MPHRTPTAAQTAGGGCMLAVILYYVTLLCVYGGSNLVCAAFGLSPASNQHDPAGPTDVLRILLLIYSLTHAMPPTNGPSPPTASSPPTDRLNTYNYKKRPYAAACMVSSWSWLPPTELTFTRHVRLARLDASKRRTHLAKHAGHRASRASFLNTAADAVPHPFRALMAVGTTLQSTLPQPFPSQQHPTL